MSRPPRIEYEGAWYHVMNRGAGRRTVFSCSDDGGLFLDLLGEVSETFGVEVHAYCLMENHYHLLVHTPRANLGRVMGHLGGVYTQRFNRLYGDDGPLFRGRYKAVLIDADGYLAQVSRYIHRNPLEAGIVSNLANYRWSSYRAYVGRSKAPEWLHRGQLLDLFGRRRQGERYGEFVLEGIDEETEGFYAGSPAGRILGATSFRRRLERALAGKPPAKGRTGAKPARERPDMERIIDRTAAAFGGSAEALRREKRGPGSRDPARMTAMALCRSPGGYPLGDIAEAFGLGNRSSVSVAASRLRERMREDGALAAKVGRLRKKLFGPGDG